VSPDENVFHVQIHEGHDSVRAFNQSAADLRSKVIEPWRRGDVIELGDMRWSPGRGELEILEGRRLRPDEISMGRGWNSARKTAQDVTEAILAGNAGTASAGADAVVAFKERVLAQCAGGRIGVHQVVWLANAEYPAAVVSERIALAERAIWELLHQGRLRIFAARSIEAADPADWQRILLDWATWADPSGPSVLLEPTGA
jgi:hypothetical protein